VPQLDIDLLENFLFFAFVAFLLGFGDDECEVNVIDISSEAYIAQHFISKQKIIIVNTSLLCNIIN